MPGRRPPTAASADDMISLVFTSGTTGHAQRGHPDAQHQPHTDPALHQHVRHCARTRAISPICPCRTSRNGRSWSFPRSFWAARVNFNEALDTLAAPTCSAPAHMCSSGRRGSGSSCSRRLSASSAARTRWRPPWRRTRPGSGELVLEGLGSERGRVLPHRRRAHPARPDSLVG